MPPIKVAAAAIRSAEDRRLITWLFLSVLLGSKSLSDICLKVYFSEDFSDAEYIILNIALYCFFRDDTPEEPEAPENYREEYKLSCQQNLETALSGLSLHIIPSHDMTLALLSGAIYAIELSQPSMAWTLVLAAYQGAHFLGYHTRKPGSSAWCDTSSNSGLLFWAIYFLEKTLCLRLGRCSTIPDFEITVPFPGGSPAMDYCRNMVKLATLAGKIYEKLYSAQALISLNKDGAFRVMTLSQELDAIHEQSQNAIREWHQSAVHGQQRALIEYMSASDEIVRHSMQTLIHRTLPAPVGSHVSFTKECIDSARKALMCHQSSSILLLGTQPSLLSSYMSWIILFTPFAPFIVLFCHVLETGDWEDLDRMQKFVNSIKPAHPVSSIVSKHHRLFQIFYEVALRYNELKSTSKMQQNGCAEVSTEFYNCLNALGFQPPVGTSDMAGGANATLNDNSYEVSADVSADTCRGIMETDPASQLPAWFNMSQQMMGLLNNDDMPF
ncbi:Putative transcriptional regulatory protein C11D3.07c [Fusarium odoratissimum]|uniref:Putative transcriptional regulatory protein C11D3.07c n=1 Tax=Fusarium oxysporum f. sp. cubense (strain race 4) TaxID=2502994 RepID=N1R6D0_FUSC4|nr:Putative transcriptional regulatory protein C11D3.07c [Fusarium odoratissimum]